jgi:protoheme IX farnesyltransferase
MGWVACTGYVDPGAILLGTVLYAWQFPHFNSLSWNLRPDYSKAGTLQYLQNLFGFRGYRMMSVTDPALNARVSLKYSLVLFPVCWMAPAIGLTTSWFLLDSTIINGVISYYSVRFWKNSDDQSARYIYFEGILGNCIAL